MAPRLPGIGSHHAANPITDEWLTPPGILAALGPFDLDPCAPAEPPWPTATRVLTAVDDGLTAPWDPDEMAWVNPPYSEAGAWMRRLAEHGNGIALVFARTDTRWWFTSIWPEAHALLFLQGRIDFHRPDGTVAAHNSGGPSVLVAYGAVASERLRTCGLAGAFTSVIRVNPAPPWWC